MTEPASSARALVVWTVAAYLDGDGDAGVRPRLLDAPPDVLEAAVGILRQWLPDTGRLSHQVVVAWHGVDVEALKGATSSALLAAYEVHKIVAGHLPRSSEQLDEQRRRMNADRAELGLPPLPDRRPE